jgi:hypothetical protein
MGLAGVALVAATVLARAAGIFPGFPTVGTPGYPALTGLETIPADTNATGGAGPSTILLTACQVGAGAVNPIVPLTGFAVTIPNGICMELLVPAGTLATGTVTMPSAPIDGQIVRIASTQTITGLTVSPNTGQAVAAPIPTILTVSATTAYGYAWVFKSAAIGAQAANTWYRIQ